MLIVKDNMVVVTCNYHPCPNDIASRGEIAVDIEGQIGDAVVDGVLFPNPATGHHVFDATVPGWVFDLELAREVQLVRLQVEERRQILQHFPDVGKCQAVRDRAASYKDALDASTSENELNGVVFDWTV